MGAKTQTVVKLVFYSGELGEYTWSKIMGLGC
jgi:hypothetical protein